MCHFMEIRIFLKDLSKLRKYVFWTRFGSKKAPKTNPDIEDPCKTLPQRIRIDVKVENQLNAFIIINDKGCLGSELSFYGKPGDKVRIIIEASKHHRFLQQFILNEDRKINVKLIKQSWF